MGGCVPVCLCCSWGGQTDVNSFACFFLQGWVDASTKGELFFVLLTAWGPVYRDAVPIHPSIHLKCFKRWQNTPFSYPITSSRFLHGEHAGSPKVLRSTTTSRVGWAELSLTKRGVHEEIGPSWLPLQHNMLHTRIIHSVLDVLVPTCRLCWGGGGDYLKYLAASSHS